MDLIVINGRVETMDPNNSVVQAVGIRDGRIAALARIHRRGLVSPPGRG